MKCAVRCESLLLQKAVEKFLKSHLSTYNDANIVISDHSYECQKPVLVVQKPFSKEDLYAQIDRFKERSEGEKSTSVNWDHVEQKIEKLTAAYVKKILQIMKETHER